MMRGLRRHLLGYRDSARLFAGRFSPGRAQLRHIETMLGVVRGAGLSDREAAYLVFTLWKFVVGFVGGEQAPLSAAVSAGELARAYLDVGGRLAALPVDEFPHTVAVAADLTAPDLDGRFEFALERLLAGVEGLSGPGGPRS